MMYKRWKEAQFKEKKVWVLVDNTGSMVVTNGRTSMRYSKTENCQIYTANAINIQVTGVESIELPDGVEKTGDKVQSIASKKQATFGSAKTRTASQKINARADAEHFLQTLSADTIVCFTDGSCVGNPGPAGVGVFIPLPQKNIMHFRFLGSGTNNIAEINAVIDALELLQKEQIPASTPIVVCTDSSYVQGLLEKGWKAKANVELVQKMKSLTKNFTSLKVRWVAGHAGIDGNDKADALANQSIQEKNTVTNYMPVSPSEST